MRRLSILLIIPASVFAGLFILMVLFNTNPANASPSLPGQEIQAINKPIAAEVHAQSTLIEPESTLKAATAAASLQIEVNYGDNWVTGATDALSSVFVTVTNSVDILKADAVVTADEAGNFGTSCADWSSGDCPDIMPGDIVRVWVDGLLNEVNPVGTITGSLDEGENTVDGQLFADWFPGSLGVSCEIWWEESNPVIATTAATNGGSFQCDFDSESWDLQRGQTVAVRYYEPDGDSVINIIQWPWVQVNYAHDWVGAAYYLDHTFVVTVTNSLGDVKATATVNTEHNAAWGGDGFQTRVEQWTPQTPDIVPGDFVYFSADDGYTNTVEVGQISPILDVDADTVSGTILAPFGISLTVECHAWGAWDVGMDWVPAKTSWAEADGSVPFLCDWSSEWDIQPGQDIGIMYVEPDGDYVIDAVREPAAFLRVYKDAEGDPTEFGNFLYHIGYENTGDATAENVQIIDLLTGGASYLADTSGLGHTGSGSGPITWDIGTLDPGQSGNFDLFVEVTSSSGEWITNTATITTTSYNQGYPDYQSAIWENEVVSNDTHLNLGQWAWTGDPAPGNDFVLVLGVCNNGSTGSSQVLLQDYPQQSVMTLQGWWSQDPGWIEDYFDGNQLMVKIPSIPGHSCSQVYVLVSLDAGATPGDYLSVLAIIDVANDLETDDNEAWWEGNANDPYVNLYTAKSWHWGQLYPGGELTYGLNFFNQGNIPAGTVMITDTFPVGTTYVDAWLNDVFGGSEFPPTVVTDDYAMWELAGIDNGTGGDIEITLAVDPETPGGTVLENKVEISHLPFENSYLDNEDTWVEILNEAGPNLRVHKYYNWEGDELLNYQVQFENIGSETISDFWITDTFQGGQEWGGWWDLSFDWERLITYTEDVDVLSWNFSEFYPGDSGWLYFNGHVLEPGVPMRWFTNTVEITTPTGDVNPDDNHDETIAFSGGEIRRAEVWINPYGDSSMWGEAVPGYPVTITSPLGIAYTTWADPGCGGCWNVDNVGPLTAGDFVLVEAGFAIQPVVIEIPGIGIHVDSAADEVSGQIIGWPDQLVEIHGDFGYQETTTDGAGNFLANYDDIPRGGGGYIRFINEVNYAEVIYHQPFYSLDLVLNVNYGHDWIEGNYEPGHTLVITVTAADGSTVKGVNEMTSDFLPGWEQSGFATHWGNWLGDQPNLVPDDWVFIKADNGYTNAVQIGEIDFVVDYGADLVTGNLFAPVPEPTVQIACQLWGPDEAPSIAELIDPAGGSFSCDFGAIPWDIGPGDTVAVTYIDSDGDQIINTADWPQLTLVIGPWSDGNRQIWGNAAPPDSPVAITVTTDLGSFVASTIAHTNQWGDFDTGYDLPENTLLDWYVVLADFGNGITDTVTVYPMDGQANPDTDVITITAASEEFFSIDLEVCVSQEGWCDWFNLGEIGQSGELVVDMATDFGFDVMLGQEFNAHMNVYNNHSIRYAWGLPAPDLNINKWHSGNYARPDGVIVYGIEYRNDGNGLAEGVTISDTLPAGTTYIADTGTLSVTVGPGDLVTWDLGSLEPGEQGAFMVTLLVDSGMPEGEGAIEPNCASINTTTPGEGNYDDNLACTNPVDVWQDEVEIGVDKWPNPWDPTPGQEFEYGVQWCNNRGAAAGPVTMTDTLPVGTTLLGWWPQNWNETFWYELPANPGELVLYAPGLPGDYCEQITVRLLLDPSVEINTILENLVVIDVDGDVDPENNWILQDRAQVGGPRYDLQLHKSRNDAILVPAGYVAFSLDYNNQGNVESTVRVTDTLPPGLSYVEGWWSNSTPWEGQPIPDPAVIGNLLIWDLPVIPVNGQHGINIVLAIDEGVTPGSELQNCAIIQGEGADSYPSDNESCLTFSVQPSGPNLGVDKWHDWRGDGQLYYQFNFANFGDHTVSDVWITDTLPLGTNWDGWWNLDFEWERLVEGDVIVNGNQLLWHFSDLQPGEWGSIQFNANLDNPGAPAIWYTNTLEITIPDGETLAADNFDGDGAFSGGELRRIEFWLPIYGNSDMWGEAAPGLNITVTTEHDQYYAWADPDCGGCWNIPETGVIEPGDVIEVIAGEAIVPVTIHVPDPISAEVDRISGEIFGQIGGWDTRPVEIHGDWPGGYRHATSAADGTYQALYGEIPRGAEGYVRISDNINFAEVVFHKEFRSPDIILNVNYGHDWIEGQYEPGHTLWITVTESDGETVKGMAELTSGEVPGWDGSTGFTTYWQGWLGAQPDIQAGDWIFGRADNGYTATVQVFTIDGFVSVDNDDLTGIVVAPWYIGEVDLLEVECHPWGAWDQGWNNVEVKYSSAPPDGSSPFYCGWDPATEWDVDYFQDIAVWVQDPAGHWIANVLSGEAIDLHVSTWSANNYARPGGVAVYGLYYHNNGNVAAENVKIIDTLPMYTSYADDASGFPVTIGAGNVITWDLGAVDPDDYGIIWLTVDVSESAPMGPEVIEPNEVAIISTTPDEAYPGDEEASSNPMDVQDDELEIGVDKGVWPEDPYPGEIFYYNIQWCNNRGAAAGPVVLTDTLPAGTTLLEWNESDWWLNFWAEISFDGSELVLYAPGLPGDRCENIDLLMQLDPDVPVGTTLVNQVAIATDGDVDDGNDFRLNDAAQASPARYDLGVFTNLSDGVFSPGGWGVFQVHFWNVGNISSTVVITEAVPPGLEFSGAWWTDEFNEQPLPEPEVFGNLLIWRLEKLSVGGGRSFALRFDIDPGVLPDTEFGNCVAIGAEGEDGNFENNESCDVLVANPPGPNLRVIKSHNWLNEGQIQYEITFLNVGTEPFANVLISDTLPISTTAANEPGIDYWSNVHIIDNTAEGEWGFVVEDLPEGESGRITFDVNVDDPEQVPAWYTNTVEIFADGDIDPSDNIYHDLAGKVPDTTLSLSPPEAQLSVGDTITMAVTVENVTGMQAIELEMSFDPSLMEVIDANPGVAGVQVIPGSCPTPDIVPMNDVDNGTGVISYHASTFLSPACSGNGVVMEIVFKALSGGTSAVQFDSLNLIDPDGFDIPVIVEGGSIEISSMGLLQGQVELQGRHNHSGAQVCVEDSQGVENCMETGSSGLYSFWLETDFYTVTVDMVPYLGAEKGNVFVAAGSTTTLSKVKILGGDVDGNGLVNIQDIAFIGGRYLTVCGDGTYQSKGDPNGDCLIDIRDLAITGGNYFKTSPVYWP